MENIPTEHLTVLNDDDEPMVLGALAATLGCRGSGV